MKRLTLILIILMIIISCSKIQEKKRIEMKNNNRFRMKKFTQEDIPQFKFLHNENPMYEKKDNKIRFLTYSCKIDGESEGINNVVYIKNNFMYTTGGYNERIKKTKKFDLIIKNNKIEFIKISEWKQTEWEKQMERYFLKQREEDKFLTYFLNITDEKIAKFIPEGVAIRFYKKLDFNRDGKMDYFILFSYPVDFMENNIIEELRLYIILSNKNGYSLQLNNYYSVSLLCSIVDVKIYKNKFIFISTVKMSRTGGDGEFELYWYE